MLSKYEEEELYIYFKNHNDVDSIINGLFLNEGHSFDIALCSNKDVSKSFFNYLKIILKKKNNIYIDVPSEALKAIEHISDTLDTYKEKDNTDSIFVFDFTSIDIQESRLKWIFSKLNISRNSFIFNLNSPFIFILPTSSKINFMLMAPDFYSICKDNALLDIVINSTDLIDTNKKDNRSHIETSLELEKLLKIQDMLKNKTFATDDEELSILREKMINHINIGDYLKDYNDFTNTIDEYRKSLNLSENIQNKRPDRIEAKRDLSVSLNKISDIYLQKGEVDNALKGYERGLKLREDIQNKRPDSIEAKRDLSVSLSKISDIYLQKGEVDNALKGYERGLKLSEDIQNKRPDSIEAKRDLSVSLEKISNIYLQKGEVDNALKGYERGLKLREDIQNKRPDSIEAKRDLSVSFYKISDIYLQKGEVDNALKGYERGLKLSEDIQNKRPDSIEAKRDLSVSFYKIALAYKGIKNFGKSIEYFTQAKKTILHLRYYEYGAFSEMIDTFDEEVSQMK